MKVGVRTTHTWCSRDGKHCIRAQQPLHCLLDAQLLAPGCCPLLHGPRNACGGPGRESSVCLAEIMYSGCACGSIFCTLLCNVLCTALPCVSHSCFQSKTHFCSDAAHSRTHLCSDAASHVHALLHPRSKHWLVLLDPGSMLPPDLCCLKRGCKTEPQAGSIH